MYATENERQIQQIQERKKNRQQFRKVQFEYRDRFFTMARHYFVAAVLLGLFSFIYEKNSHGVYTIYMTHLALIPFLLGALPAFLMGVYDAGANKHIVRVEPWTRVFWFCSVLTLSLGSAVMGALVIYGTSTNLMIVYPIVGGILLLTAIVLLVRDNHRFPERKYTGTVRQSASYQTEMNGIL